MKKIILLIPLLIISTLLFGDNNLYTGSAARGSDSSFNIPDGKEGFYGISLIVPAGKTLRVTNLKNNKTIEIQVVDGKGKPGIQLLLNSQASDALDIYPGEVSQVSSFELGKEANPFLSYNDDPEGFKEDLEEEFLEKEKDDPDYGSSVDIDKEMEKLGYEKPLPDELAEETAPEPEPVPEPELIIEELPPVIPEEDGDEEFEEIIIAHVKDDIDDTLEIEDTLLENEPEITPKEEEPVEPEVLADIEPEPEEREEPVIESADEPFLSDIITVPEKDDDTIEEPAKDPLVDEVVEEPLDTADESPVIEEEREDSPPKNPGSVIYFLTQAEPRPPQVEENLILGEEPEEVKSDKPDTVDIEEKDISTLPSLDGLVINGMTTFFTPQYIEPEAFNDYIDEIEENGSRFIQIFQFNENNKDALMKNMEKLYEAFPYLPITVDNEKKVLLAGPVSRDEVGILLYAVKAHGFSDAIVKRVSK